MTDYEVFYWKLAIETRRASVYVHTHDASLYFFLKFVLEQNIKNHWLKIIIFAIDTDVFDSRIFCWNLSSQKHDWGENSYDDNTDD